MGKSNSIQRGFTLVELMIVVAIIGVLAAVAIQGVQRYLASSKTSEAKNNLGAITRAAVSAYERDSAAAELLSAGKGAKKSAHQLCGNAAPVPNKVPKGNKYQPDTAKNQDFNKGDDQTGWPCLKFEITQPIYYQYNYRKGKSVIAKKNPAKSGKNGFEAAAVGDLDGDGIRSIFAMTGDTTASGTSLKISTSVYGLQESE